MRTIPKSITRDLLNRLYIEENKSCLQVGKEINKSHVQVLRYLKRFGIKTRPASITIRSCKGKTLSEETKNKIRQKHIGKKLSSQHRTKVIKTLRFGRKGKDNPSWKGGRHINPKGYIYLSMPDHPMMQSNGYVAEHRYVVSEKLGRPLTRFEHIHHINGIKSDNRIENLELLNGQTHSLVTRMESRIRELEKENQKLRIFLGNVK